MDYKLYVFMALAAVFLIVSLIIHHYQETVKLEILFKVSNLLSKAEMQKFEEKLEDMLPYEVRRLNRLTPEDFELKVREMIAPKD